MVTKTLKYILLAFAAGAAGGLANSFVLWLFGSLHITTGLGVSLAPSFTPAWLYPRIVWGGIWAVLLFIPILANANFVRGLILSIGPTIVQLLVIFPTSGQGYFGFALGALTPLFVIIFNAVWGVVCVYLYEMTWKK